MEPMSVHVYRTRRLNPDARCSKCRNRIDGATGVNEERAEPQPGGYSICCYCGQVGIYQADFTVRPIDAGEVAALAATSPEFAERLKVLRGCVAQLQRKRRRLN